MAKQLTDDFVSKARVKLQLKDRFLGALLMLLDMQPCDSIDTAGTDGSVLLYNPEWCASLDIDEFIGLLAHECMHVALQHPMRAEKYKLNKELYNIAADIVINDFLHLNNYSLPKGVLFDTHFRGMTTEEVYAEIKNNPNMQALARAIQESKAKVVLGSDLLQPKEGNDAAGKLATAKITSQNQKSASLENSEIIREFNALMNPTLPWNVILRRYVNGLVKDDYSWSRPNRRYQDYYMPSIVDTETLTKVNVYIDVSGSVNDDTVTTFLSELKGIYNHYGLEAMDVSFFSTRINKTVHLTDKWKDIKISDSDGGTSIRPVIENLNKNKANINIVFTDGYFDEDPIDRAKYPLLWLIYDNNKFKPSKGKVIEIPD